MTDHLVHISRSIIAGGGYTGPTLPRPDLIPVPRVAKAWAALIDAHALTDDLAAKSNSAMARVRQAEGEDRLRMTALFEAGQGADADPREATKIAEEELKDARARIDPVEAAERTKYQALREAIAAGKRDWQKVARKNAGAARDRLALALKSVEIARADLEANLGILELLSHEELPPSVNANWTSGNIEVGTAVEKLGEALVVVDRQIRTL